MKLQRIYKKKRLGDKQTLISCHMNELPSSNNVYDSTEVKKK